MHWTEDFLTGGNGPPIILLHGWPFHNQCFRKVTPAIERHFTWYAPNAMGMNAAGFDKNTDFSFEAHAERLLEFAAARNLSDFSVVAHDTGGTVARIAASQAPDRINRLVLLNTEMPGHRPPFILLYQRSSYVPGNRIIQSFLLRQSWFQRSVMGFGGSFYEIDRMDDEFRSLFIYHWLDDKERFRGLIRYLQGLNFGAVDRLKDTHQALQCPVHFVWGQEDPTFPINEAREMVKDIPCCRDFIEIERACFLLHEERPDVVAEAIVTCLKRAY